MKNLEQPEWERSFSEFLKSRQLPAQNMELYLQAMAHRCYSNESSAHHGHNERLEFLGDSVVGLIISDLLVQTFVDLPEGVLSRRRALLVSEVRLSEKAKELKLQNWLLLGKGEEATGTRANPRILASALEALVGAIYLDLGWPQAFQFVEMLFRDDLHRLDAEEGHYGDYKTELQEKLQKERKITPTYHVIQEAGPEHQKTFLVEVRCGDQKLATGTGSSKKMAEQQAAQKALRQQENV